MAFKPKNDPWVRSFSVTDPTLHPNGYTVYKVKMQAFCTHAPDETKETCVWKRYSDFKKLHTVLSTLHKNLHRPGLFPGFAEPVVFGRFNSDVIEVRRKSALAMLQFIGSQSHLYKSPAFQDFLKVSESIPCTNSQSDHCDVLSPCCVHPAENIQALPSTMGSIWSAPAAATPSPSVPPVTQQGVIDMPADFKRPTIVPAAIVDLSESPATPLPPFRDDLHVSTDHLAEGAAYRASRELSMFDPLRNESGGTEKADGAAAVESDVLEDLAAWADVRGPLRLPEVPAAEPDLADPDLQDTTVDGAGRAPPVEYSRTDDPLEGLPMPPTVTVADLTTASDDYLSDAEAQAKQGERYFMLGKHEVSLKHYECAVTLLVRGVQDDVSEKRRGLAGKRTQQYLEQAQRIAKGFLHKNSGSCVAPTSDSSIDVTLAAPTLRLGAVSFDAAPHNSLPAAGEGNVQIRGKLRGSVEELSNYKVLGVIDKVMLVLDKLTEHTYVMKVLQKNELGDQGKADMQHTIPTNCPHMVHIHRYYETESTIYLLLQHASGGRLWSYAASYLHSLSGMSVRPRLLSSKGDTDNVYSGRRCAADSLSEEEATPAAAEQDECSKAYLDLLYDTSRLAPKPNCEEGGIPSPNQVNSTDDEYAHRGVGLTSHAQKSLFPLSRSTSDSSATKFATPGTVSSGAAPARRWSVASDELGLPPPPFHRPTSAAISHHQSVPESCVRQWAAEILAAVVHLHSLGVVCRDLRPDNILLGEGGHILLTFFGKWAGVHSTVHADALRDFYAAPELQKPLTPGVSVPVTCDWWSLGVLLYELLVGQSLRSVHPDGIGTHTALWLPAHLSIEARDLLTQLVKHNPSERLGCGPAGEEDIMSHPFFAGVDWSTVSRSQT